MTSTDRRFVCPFPGCTRSFRDFWRLKVHYRAPPDARGSGVERGHGQELPTCPLCSADLKHVRYHKCPVLNVGPVLQQAHPHATGAAGRGKAAGGGGSSAAGNQQQTGAGVRQRGGAHVRSGPANSKQAAAAAAAQQQALLATAALLSVDPQRAQQGCAAELGPWQQVQQVQAAKQQQPQQQQQPQLHAQQPPSQVQQEQHQHPAAPALVVVTDAGTQQPHQYMLPKAAAEQVAMAVAAVATAAAGGQPAQWLAAAKRGLSPSSQAMTPAALQLHQGGYTAPAAASAAGSQVADGSSSDAAARQQAPAPADKSPVGNGTSRKRGSDDGASWQAAASSHLRDLPMRDQEGGPRANHAALLAAGGPHAALAALHHGVLSMPALFKPADGYELEPPPLPGGGGDTGVNSSSSGSTDRPGPAAAPLQPAAPGQGNLLGNQVLMLADPLHALECLAEVAAAESAAVADTAAHSLQSKPMGHTARGLHLVAAAAPQGSKRRHTLSLQQRNPDYDYE